MTGGMTAIAGTVMVLYAGVVGSVVPDAMGYIVEASIISALAAVLIALILVPLSGSAMAR